MLQVRQGDSATFILTLTEKQTTASPDYYFVFTHVITKDQVTFTRLEESLFPARYNKFTINGDFDDKPVGEWHYKVYEDDENGVVLEEGKLMVERATDFDYTKYDSSNSFKTYNG